MTKRFSFEFKIAGIMLIVLALVGITGIYAYKRFTEIVLTISRETRPDIRLVTAKALTFDITNAENSVKSYTLTKDDIYLDEFYASAEHVNQKLSALHNLSAEGKELMIDLDELDSLITGKFRILDNLLGMQDDFRVQVALDKVVDKIEKTAAVDSERIKTKNRAKPVKIVEENEDEIGTIEDEAEDKPEKRRILGWLFKKKKDKEEIAQRQLQEKASKEKVITSVPEIESEQEPEPESGTGDKITLYTVNKEVQKVKSEEKSIEAAIKARELELIIADKAVSDRIRAMLKDLEIAETEHLALMAEKAEMAVTQTNREIALFCVLTGLMLLFMAFIILNYVRNNKRYRKALRKARKEAEELAVTKERFMANMSHEIRTPMNAIAGFAEQIAEGPLNKEQRDQINIVRKSAEHLQYLINDVLDLTKLQAGKLKLEKVAFRPDEIIEDVVSFMQPIASEEKLKLHFNIDKTVPEVLKGDPFRLRQILLNLVSNAVKFTENGTVTIEASAIMRNDDVMQLRLEIIDTGIGMDEDQLKKLYVEFEQAQVSTARIYGGTGLGLSITKMLVELHQGKIHISSTREKGTRVEIELPYEIGSTENIDTDVPTTASGAALENIRVLIVDDEAYNRKLLATILRKYKAILTEAADGLEAVEEVKRNNYDIIFMDIRMPELNGIEATKKIRKMQDENKKATPIIALTAAVLESDRKEYKKAGMNGFLAKPYREAELLRQITSAIQSPDVRKATITETKANEKKSSVQLDLKELKSISNGDNAFFTDMLQTFSQGTRNGLQEIREAFEKEDWQAIGEIAHKMASPARHLSAERLYKHLKEIEHRCRNNENIASIGVLIDLTEQESELVLRAVEDELQKIEVDSNQH